MQGSLVAVAGAAPWPGGKRCDATGAAGPRRVRAVAEVLAISILPRRLSWARHLSWVVLEPKVPRVTPTPLPPVTRLRVVASDNNTSPTGRFYT